MMTAEQQVLLRLVSSAMRGETVSEIPPDLDWDALLDECRHQAVRALSYFSVAPDVLPDGVKTRWSQAAYQDVAAYFRVGKAHVDVCKLLEDNGIPTVILKGCASARYYPHPEYRSMGYVDFYVAQENIEKSRALLEANGYTDDHRIGDHDWSYHKGGIHFELHFAVSGVPSGEDGKAFREYFETLLDQRQFIETQLGTICVPSDFHHGLIILLHTASHLLGGGLGLRHLCDWAAFVNGFSDETFCELFLDTFQELRVCQFAQVMTRCCEKYLGLAAHSWTKDVDETAADLFMNELLANGNFGAKGKQRKSDIMLSEGFSVRLGKKTGLRSMLVILRKTTERQWPVAAHVKLLLPFGMLYFALRYAIRMLLGKREKLNLVAMSREAKERKELFTSFGLVDGMEE